ncbi:MAG: hypothetical protein U1E52_10200 [Geminicoccaceae bacterium]
MLRASTTICAVVMLAALPAAANPTVRINLGPGGREANGYSPASDISANGRWVAFSSDANNLVPGPRAVEEDVYLRDLQNERTELVSLGVGGVRGNNGSFNAKLSADGRFVCFPSFATNLVPGDTNRQTDIFLRDRRLGTLSRINVDSKGRQALGVTFDCDISASGRYIVFDSDAGNLVPGDTNHDFDVFLLDRVARTISRVSLGVGGQQARGGFSASPSLSDDGRFLAFASAADNIVERRFTGRSNVIVRNLKTGRNTLASRGRDGGPIDFGAGDPAISGDGRFVAFDSNSTNLVPGDTNENDDIFVFDRKTGRTERVSVATDGTQGDSSSLFPRISGDGRFVLFTSYADNLVPGDTNGTYDVFVHDRATHTTARVSVDSHGRQGDGPSQDNVAIAHDGSFVVFSSGADNLVPDDRNDNWDVFLHRGAPLAEH